MRVRSLLVPLLLCAALWGHSLPSCARSASSGPQPDPIVRLGISNYATPTPHEELYARTIETIRQVIAPSKLEVTYYSPGELSRAVQTDSLHIVFGSSGFYRRTALKTGNRELVSLASASYPNPNHVDGAAIVVRSDRSDIQSIADLKGKIAEANRPFTFTGFLVPMGAVAAAGGDPEHFFSRIDFKGEGSTMQLIAEDVINGKADAGFLRLCMLETLTKEGKIPSGALKVVGEKTQNGEACRRSTELYPGWTISTTPIATPELSRALTLALLSQPPVGDDLHWGIATNYQSVDALYRELKLGPYEYLRQWTLERFVERWWAAIMLATAGVLVLAIFAFVQNGQLRRAIAREARLQEASRKASEQLDIMQKIWAVGQISSTIAHELRQPLASIACIARGLMLMFDRGRNDPDKAKEGLEVIEAQAQRVSDIVEKVRSYARVPAGERRRVDLRESVANAVQTLKTAGRDKTSTIFVAPMPQADIEADPVEIELVIVNILKNALEAASCAQNPRVTVTLSVGDAAVVLRVADNGPGIDDEGFARLSEPFKSSKADGLGLGLAIVKTIVERHAGNLVFERNQRGSGLTVSVTLPLLA